MGRMRIGLWATAGFVVGCGWVAIAFATAPDIEVKPDVVGRAIQALAYSTCPIIITGVHFYLVPVANAISYALVGLLWQLIRRNSK
jgi:hypothetical protein